MSVAAPVVSADELGHADLARRTGLGASFGRATMSNHRVALQNCHDRRADRGIPGRAAPAGVRSGRRGARQSGAGARRRAAVARCDRQRRLDARSRRGAPQPRRSSRGALRTDRVRDRSLRSVADGAWFRDRCVGIRVEGGGGRGADERRPFGPARRTSHRSGPSGERSESRSPA